MKAIDYLTILLLSAALVACGDEDSSIGTGQGSALACDTVAWCTSYGPATSTPENIPDLNGGSIADGLYRRQKGTFSAEAFAISRNTVVFIGSGFRNEVGTWTVDDGTFQVSLDTQCSASGDSEYDVDIAYDFAVAGNSIYLNEQGCIGTCKTHRFDRVSSLCDTDEEFKCRVSNCQCVETQGSGLPETGEGEFYCQS